MKTPELLHSYLSSIINSVVSGKPSFLRLKTTRLRSHSKGDDNRPNSYIEEINAQDVLTKLIASNINFKNNYELALSDYSRNAELYFHKGNKQSLVSPVVPIL